MDLVPLEFSERVAAAWKCCEDSRVRCRCVTPVFSTRNWTFLKALNATFVVVPYARGKWRYNFRLESGIEMTMSELLEHPDFKNLRIDPIDIDGMYSADRMKPVSGVGMKKLLNFVSFLANEPRVSINNRNARTFSSPEGALLLTWLEQRWFSDISIATYRSVFNRLIQKQFSRRIPPNICVYGVYDTEFFANQLRSGQMTRFQADRIALSSDVMEGIVQSFLRSPSAKKIDIDAYFDDSTESRLMEMEEGGLCRRVDGKFIFENPFHRLEVSRSFPSYNVFTCNPSEWKCVTVNAKFGLRASVVLKQSSALNGWKMTTWFLWLRQKLSHF